MDAEPREPGRTRALWVVGFSGLLALTLLGGVLLVSGREGSLEGEPTDSAAVELERLRRENRVLRMELELASAEGPYLVLDLDRRIILLKFHGTLLREFPLRNASVRTRRLLGARGGVAAAMDTVWGGGDLLPPIHWKRVEILADTVTPPDPSGAVTFIPPTPEQEAPTPASFRIRFPHERSLFVRVNAVADTLGAGDGSDSPVGGSEASGSGSADAWKPPSLWGRPLHWLRMGPWLRDRLRVEVTLSPAEAGALYRAYGDGTPLLVLGPGPSHGRTQEGKTPGG